MRKTPFTLITLILSLGMASAWGQHTVLDHLPRTPLQEALGERVLAELLSATGGDDALFRKVTGGERLPTQKLFLSIPDAALQTGTITYPRQPDFVMAGLWDQAAQCQAVASSDATDKTPGKKHGDRSDTVQQMQLITASVVSTKSVTIPNTGQWSAVRADPRAPAWAVQVEPVFDVSAGVLAQRYQFLPAGATLPAIPDTVLKFTAPLTAEYGTKAVYRQQAVVMHGSRSPFVATAMVNSDVPLQFNVRTIGDVGWFSFAPNEHRAMQLNNLPAAGAAIPASDVRLGSRVLQSPNGAFLLGREQGTSTAGAYSVVDAIGSTNVVLPKSSGGAAPLQRVWTSRGKGACKDSDLVLNTAGDLLFICNGSTTWLYKNADNAHPCRHLTLSNAGELTCYSDPVTPADTDAAAKVVFRTPASHSTHASAPPTLNYPFRMTWQQLTGNASHSFSFFGEYSGDRVVSPVVSCNDAVVTLPAQPADCERNVAATRSDTVCDATRTALARLRGRTQSTAATQP